MPLAICPALRRASLTEIDRCNQEVKQRGNTSYLFQEIDLDMQLRIMKSWIWSVINIAAKS